MEESDFDNMENDHLDRLFDGDDEPDYYYCSCCNHTQVKPGMGNGCDNCGLFNVMEEGNF